MELREKKRGVHGSRESEKSGATTGVVHSDEEKKKKPKCSEKGAKEGRGESLPDMKRASRDHQGALVPMQSPPAQAFSTQRFMVHVLLMIRSLPVDPKLSHRET